MISRSATRQKSLSVRPGRSKVRGRKVPAIDHAVRLIHRVCCLAGSADLIDSVRSENGGLGVTASIRNGDTPALFDHLVSALSYQGISDQVAEAYMERYGSATWADIQAKLVQDVPCPKLKSYRHFHGCRYDKLSGTCAEPDHIEACPLPTHYLRNGRLNQMAYSLFLFAVAKKLPVGRLYGNGRGFVPTIRQELYSEIVVALSEDVVPPEPETMPVASGLPRTWDEIAAGHLVIAQETLALGWWEAIVIARKDDMFSLRFRDYPKIPKFVRHRSAISLMSPPVE